MPISKVEKSGTYYVIYNERGRKLTSLNVNKGELLGYCRAFLMLRNGSWYDLYDENAHKYASINKSKGEFMEVTPDDAFVLRLGSTDYMFDKDGIKINTKSKNAKWGRSSVLAERERKARQEEERLAKEEERKRKQEQQKQADAERRQREKEKDEQARKLSAQQRQEKLDQLAQAQRAQKEQEEERKKQAVLQRQREQELRELEQKELDLERQAKEQERKERELDTQDEEPERPDPAPAPRAAAPAPAKKSADTPAASPVDDTPEIERLRQQFAERERALKAENDRLRAHASRLSQDNEAMQLSAVQNQRADKSKSPRVFIIILIIAIFVGIRLFKGDNKAEDTPAEVAQQAVATIPTTHKAPAPIAEPSAPEETPAVTAPEPPTTLPESAEDTPGATGQPAEVEETQEDEDDYPQRSNVGSEEWNQATAVHLVTCYLTPEQFGESSVDCLHFPLMYSGEEISTREQYLRDDEQYRKRWSKMTYICEEVQLNDNQEDGIYTLSAWYYCELVSTSGKVTRLRCRNDFKIRSFPTEGLRIYEIQENILDKNAVPRQAPH